MGGIKEIGVMKAVCVNKLKVKFARLGTPLEAEE